MSLEQLSKTVDFVQAATPSNANDGETYLDTSQSPPQLKVFNSSANAFVRPRSIQNLDAPVSGAGATQSDIETAVDNSNTASTVSTNLDAKVSSAGQGVDWASKTQRIDQVGNANDETFLNVSGSGYLVGAHLDASNSFKLSITVDGTSTSFGSNAVSNPPFQFNGLHRFDSSLKMSENGGNGFIFGGVFYVLD